MCVTEMQGALRFDETDIISDEGDKHRFRAVQKEIIK